MPSNRRQRKQNFLLAVASQVGWPLLWGMAAWVGFYVLIQRGVISSESVRRYFAGHPVEYFESAMFFVGVAALAIKLLGVVQQHFSLSQVKLPAVPPDGTRVDDCPSLLASLSSLPARLHDSYLVRRLREALEYVHRKRSADDLDEQLRFLADVDAGRQQDGYALVRLVIWAIPILGFLGTVIGITLAFTSLGFEINKDSIGSLTGALSIAFDTTTVALALSIVLMFSQFLVERFETELLSTVDERVNEELVGRFEEYGAGTDPNVASMRRMADEVVQATQKLVTQQTELWQHTIHEAHEHWQRLSRDSSDHARQAISAGLADSLKAHAHELATAEKEAAVCQTLLFSRLETSLDKYTLALENQQSQLLRQGDVLSRAIEASGEVSQLQHVLNQNLESLAGAKNFEDTVMSLAAAIHLLNSRLGGTGGRHVELEHAKPNEQGRAA